MFSISDAHKITDPVLREQIEQHPRAQEILRAFLYPYDAPDYDFLFADGTVRQMVAGDIDRLTAGRTPVLAVGSNRAPVQLARKFAPPHHHEEPVPVTFGWMTDQDIVYSAHMAGYGALPATLASSPGTTVRVAVTWLTPTQLSHMHSTESVPDHYKYCQLDGTKITLDCGLKAGRVGSYQSVAGHVFDHGDTFALVDIPARNRRFVARSQWEMLSQIAKRAGQAPHPTFVLKLIDDADLRRKLVGRYLKTDNPTPRRTSVPK